MSDLNHEFMIIEKYSFSLDKCPEYRKGEKVEIHDDFLDYISDSLSWVKSLNPCKNEPVFGLCWWGPTIFQDESIQKLENIISAWVLLLKNAPSTIELTGGYTWIEGESHETGEYQKLIYSQKIIVSKLEKLISFCKTIKKENNKCLLHLGI